MDDFQIDEGLSDTVTFLQKEFYETEQKMEKLSQSTNKNFRQSLERELRWGEAIAGSTGYFIPVKYMLPEGTVTDGGVDHLDIIAYLKISRDSSDVPKYELLNVFPDEDFDRFSGVMLAEDYFLGDVKHNFFKEGESMSATEIMARKRSVSSNSKELFASGMNCHTYKVGTTCVGDLNGGSAPDICVDNYETSCNHSGDMPPIDYETYDPDGFDGGGGGTTGPAPGPIPKKQKVVDNKYNDPCKGVKLANKLSSIKGIKDLINNIKGKSSEYAAAIKLSNPNDPTSITLGSTFTDSKSNAVNIIPSWSENSGYTVGFIHNHPNGSAPSPSDIFVPALNISDMIQTNAVSEAQLNNYLDNFASIVVSGDKVFTITIKNAAYFKAMQDAGYFAPGFNRSKVNREFSDNMIAYANKNNLDLQNALHNREAGIGALLKMYGDIINIMEHKVGETSAAKNLKHNSSRKVTSNNPC